MRKGQGRKPKLNNRDLWTLRRHCIKNRHSSISDITTWAQDYFGKPLSSTTICSYIHKCQLKLYCVKRKPYVNSVQKHRRLLWAWRHLGWTITQWKRVLWSDESVFLVFFWEKWTLCAPDQRRKGSSRLLPGTSPKASVCHGQCCGVTEYMYRRYVFRILFMNNCILLQLLFLNMVFRIG